MLDIVAGIFKPAAVLIDEMHTSAEEKIDAKTRLLEAETAAVSVALDYERGVLEAKSRIVEAEAGSEHWVTATWRPITMLTMLLLVVGDSLGWLPNPLSSEAWLILQLGIGGYVGGRTIEKVVKTVKANNAE